MQMSLIDLWGTMGWFARSIVFILLFMSMVSLGNALMKWWRLRKAQRETAKFAPEFSRFLQEEQMEGAIALALKYKHSHVARVLVGALEEIKPLLRDGHITAGDINSAERAIERNQLILIAELKRGTGILATVGATAPFVGLLGTTMGVVNAFQGMASGGGSGGIAAVAGGISEALITTAFGLLVAIPAVWIYNYFQTKSDFLTVEMTYSGKELIDYLIKNVGAEFGRSSFTKDFPAQVQAVSGSGHINK
jgi:biopolymer transport protein ExbB/biopolymer transport protein TolQ